jgi:V/A-type H+-transporting ATPase subunit K
VEETIWGLSGTVWAIAGAAFAVAGGGIGSAIGLSSASNMAAGVITEDSEKFGRVLPIAAMPSTQGIYGFITFILVFVFFGLLGADTEPQIPASAGMSIFLACLPVATVCLVSAVYQGLTSAGAMGMVARRSEEAGRALIFPALVETYAVFALIATVLMLLNLQTMYGF